MDYEWTPRSSRPSKLYRVYRPYQYTTLKHNGLFASGPGVWLKVETQFSLFIQTITYHRDQQPPRISPYISAFESLTEAESWALAAEDEFGQPAYILEIDVKHKCMETATMWRVSDIQDKTGKQCGLGGKRDSEWLILYIVPAEAISKTFRSSTDVRIERGLPFPVKKEETTPPPFEETVYHGLFEMKNEPLECGCMDERNCPHFPWPTLAPPLWKD